ncbi:DUF551 domain-containing protein [Methylobacterium durans]|uniref:DUF551 domain-containing protein n=1 Tax=Methylobacterium durans TaxID=2202825 RepID=UPI003AB0E5CB
MTSSWQSIDTAPTEEGTKALLFDGRDQFVGVLTHYSRKGQWRLWTGETTVPWDGPNPTHWMPLAEPPEGIEPVDVSPESGTAAAV